MRPPPASGDSGSTTRARLAGTHYLLAACVIAFAAGLFFNLTLRSGHDWDGDFALYIMQAENIANGHPYTDTYFIANPRNAIDPALYPPGLPWLLAPVYKLYGLDLQRLKEVGVCGLVGFLLAFAYIARRFLDDVPALSVTALFAIHPYLVGLKDTIYSEFPFMLFVYATLLLSDRLTRQRLAIMQAPFAVAGLAALIALCFLTRTVGVVMFPAVLLAGVFGYRRLVNPPTVAVAASVVIVAVVRIWFPSDSGTYIGYFDQLNGSSLLAAFGSYAWALNVLLEDQVLHRQALEWLAVIGFVGLAAVGFCGRARRSPSVYEIFLAGYLALLLIFPVHLEPERYSLPVWPLLLLYCLRGAAHVGVYIADKAGIEWSDAAVRRYFPLATAILLALPWIDIGARQDHGPIAYSVTDPNSAELFERIRELPSEEVVLARKPTIVGLFTRHKASIWPDHFTAADFWKFARDVHAHYVVEEISVPESPAYFKSDRELDAFIRGNLPAFHLVFHNAWFNLYRFDPPPRQ